VLERERREIIVYKCTSDASNIKTMKLYATCMLLYKVYLTSELVERSQNNVLEVIWDELETHLQRGLVFVLDEEEVHLYTNNSLSSIMPYNHTTNYFVI
jgi:hypothetical protein